MTAATDIDWDLREDILIEPKRETDEWLAFVGAMREDPACAIVMAAAADYLQERGDIRWEALAWMAENGKTGVSWFSRRQSRNHPVYWNPSPWGESAYENELCVGWFVAADLMNTNGGIRERLAALDAYAGADHYTRARWLADSLTPKVKADA